MVPWPRLSKRRHGEQQAAVPGWPRRERRLGARIALFPLFCRAKIPLTLQDPPPAELIPHPFCEHGSMRTRLGCLEFLASGFALAQPL